MKTLVCIIPQVRTPKQTWDGFKKNVLDALDADLCLCVGVKKQDVNEYFENAKYVFTRNEPKEDWSEFYDEMSSEWRHFAHIPEGWLGPAQKPHPHKYTGGIMLFYRWWLLQNLKEHGLLEKYDQIIVTRSDYYWVKPHPRLDNDRVWFPNGEFHGGLCDRHIVVPSKYASDFLGIGGTIAKDQYEPMITFYNSRVSRGFGQQWMYNIESYLYFRYTSLFHLIGFFPQKMYLITEDMKPKYPPEFEDTQTDEPLIIWPWSINHYHLRHDMFSGKAFAIPSSSGTSW
jgi:hypothetical protein